nr:unnamed protein product [Spirometra erinaceieuropaei]
MGLVGATESHYGATTFMFVVENNRICRESAVSVGEGGRVSAKAMRRPVPAAVVQRRTRQSLVSTMSAQFFIRPSIQRSPQYTVHAAQAHSALTWFSPPVEAVARGVAAEQSPASWSHRSPQQERSESPYPTERATSSLRRGELPVPSESDMREVSAGRVRGVHASVSEGGEEMGSPAIDTPNTDTLPHPPAFVVAGFNQAGKTENSGQMGAGHKGAEISLADTFVQSVASKFCGCWFWACLAFSATSSVPSIDNLLMSSEPGTPNPDSSFKWKCVICNLGFTQKDALLHHMKTPAHRANIPTEYPEPPRETASPSSKHETEPPALPATTSFSSLPGDLTEQIRQMIREVLTQIIREELKAAFSGYYEKYANSANSCAL